MCVCVCVGCEVYVFMVTQQPFAFDVYHGTHDKVCHFLSFFVQSSQSVHTILLLILGVYSFDVCMSGGLLVCV